MTSDMKKLRCRKELGTWYYRKIVDDFELDAPYYELYDANGEWVQDFGFYKDMHYYIETGIIV